MIFYKPDPKKATIKELVATIFKNVYGDIKDIQVILPDSRKECTCYEAVCIP